MAQKQNSSIPTELEQTDCSILLDEVKEKMNILKKCGMTEDEIISQLFCCHPLPKLTISKNYRIFLGDNRIEIHSRQQGLAPVSWYQPQNVSQGL